jgi:GNAT superfamily N-acetyltransferase
MQKTVGGFLISDEKASLDVALIHGFLRESYWASSIPAEVVKRSIENSLCFGAYDNGRQVGFARVITDFATFAYLADVFVIESHRGRGISKQLIEFVRQHPALQSLRRWLLATRDAHGLYAQFGFVPLASCDRWMEIADPYIYRDTREGVGGSGS